MKFTGKFLKYLYDNFIGNFVGFAIGMASTRIVSHFFATKSIRNLWGLTARKTIVDKKTFGNLELLISVIIGFIVFEIISKWIKKKTDELMPKLRMKWAARFGKNAAVENIESIGA
jgi:hypothetical protein